MKTGDRSIQARAQYIMGNAAINLGQTKESLTYHEAAFSIYQDMENLKGLAGSYNSLGIIYQNLGDWDKALEHLEKGLKIRYQIKDSAGTSGILLNMASGFEAKGEIDRSLQLNQEALIIAQKYKKTTHEAIINNNLANNYKYWGDIDNATKHYLKARAIYEETANYWGAVTSLNNLSILHIDNKNYDLSEEYLNQAMSIALENGLTQGEAYSYINLGGLFLAKGDYSKALTSYQDGLKIIEELEMLFLQGYTELEIGRALLNLNRLDEAENYLAIGLANSKVNGRSEEVVNGYLFSSELFQKQGKWKQAKTYALEGLNLAQDIENMSQVANLAKELVSIHEHFGNSTEALRMYKLEITTRDSVYNEENTRSLINQEYQYTYQKKAYQDSLNNAAVFAIQLAENKRRKTISYFLLGSLLLTIIFGFVLYNRFRLTRKQKQIIEEEKEKLGIANSRLKEMDNFKSRFFTNISHEFRTPLTVIEGMIGEVKEKPDKWLEKGSDIIQRNTNNLLNLINQILDLRKIESGNLTLNPVQDDVVKFIRFTVSSFESLAESKEIKLNFKSLSENILLDFDPKKLGQILYNLISNALKFTPQKGEITVEVQNQQNHQYLISVTDSGIGIPPEKLPYIFDQFYQVDNSSTREGEGTGIGLSLTKELVQLMQGTITAKSESRNGTRFEILLPISNEAPLAKAATHQLPKTIPLIQPKEEKASTPFISNGEKPSLLIIEDNPDIVEYLFACLEDQYEVFSASDGQAGIDAAFEQIPDIIITDVMMPRKNGYEVCEALKLDERTSHIPIIMLTAKADQNSRLEGYKRGADAYLAKPFDREELFIRLARLLEIRKTLQKRYQAGALPPKTEDPIIQAEDEFVIKVRQLIIDNLDNHNYRGESICKDIGVSRTNLHRKIKALTGQSTSYFIRTVRIQHSKKLLLDPEVHIAEIAYSVGFRDPSYYIKIFKETEGIVPGEWRENQKHNPQNSL